MERNITDTLLELPLLQGMSRSDIVSNFDYTRLKLTSLSASRYAIRQDAICDGLLFLIDGHVVLERQSADRSWYVEEELTSPLVAGLEVLYGSTRTYPYSLRTVTPCQVFTISKQQAASLLDNNEVFRLNVLNTLTSTIARRDHQAWLPAADSLEARIMQFVRSHVYYPAGAKTLHITLQNLGSYLDMDSRYISRALHGMEQAGLLQTMRRNIHIPHLETLVQAYG